MHSGYAFVHYFTNLSIILRLDVFFMLYSHNKFSLMMHILKRGGGQWIGPCISEKWYLLTYPRLSCWRIRPQKWKVVLGSKVVIVAHFYQMNVFGMKLSLTFLMFNSFMKYYFYCTYSVIWWSPRRKCLAICANGSFNCLNIFTFSLLQEPLATKKLLLVV